VPQLMREQTAGVRKHILYMECLVATCGDVEILSYGGLGFLLADEAGCVCVSLRLFFGVLFERKAVLCRKRILLDKDVENSTGRG